MKILIIGSMAFVKDMVKVQEKLKSLGHKAEVPYGIKAHLKDKTLVDNLVQNSALVIQHNIMKKCFDQVAASEAVLVLNYKRNGIDGYIGVSALMEMAIAHHLNKKIFLMHPFPDFTKHRWAQEVANMQPVILNENLSLVKSLKRKLQLRVRMALLEQYLPLVYQEIMILYDWSDRGLTLPSTIRLKKQLPDVLL